MKVLADTLPVTVTSDLRVKAKRAAVLSPDDALRLAEELTLKAMMRKAALLPTRRDPRVVGRRAVR